MESSDIKGRLAEGLKQYDLTMEEIQSGNWFYCGGDNKEHLTYWQQRNRTKQLLGKKEWSFPPHQDHCACGHFIKNNCYITNKKQILVIGNCCIKRFIKSKAKTCELCMSEHRNRKYNVCNNCLMKRDTREWEWKELIRKMNEIKVASQEKTE